MNMIASAAPAPGRLAVTFTGRGTTYFGIWIVNLALSIVTLGIYSAWAKVRRVRYFFGNTFIGEHALDYHAPPIAILKGRIIVVAFLAAITIVNQFAPLVGGAMTIVFLFVVPLGIIYSLRFNARVTSWRNVRFNFDTKPGRDYWRALGVFVAMPIVATLSLGLLVPVVTRMTWNFIIRRLSYGSSQFAADIRLGPLYGALLGALVVLIGVALVIGLAGLAAMQLGVLSMIAGIDEVGEEMALALFFLPVIAGSILGFFALAIAGIYYSAIARNVVLDRTTIGNVAGLESRLSGLGMAWVIIFNTILVIATVGIATPWAAVRSWRYRSESLAVLATGDIDGVIASDEQAGTAVGSEWVDIQGFDVGI